MAWSSNEGLLNRSTFGQPFRASRCRTGVALVDGRSSSFVRPAGGRCCEVAARSVQQSAYQPSGKGNKPPRPVVIIRPRSARAFEDGERPRCRLCCGLENPVAQSVKLHLHKNTLSVATAFARRVLASLGRLQDRATALAARTLSRRSPMLRANEFLAVPLPSAARASGTGEIQLARLAGNAGSAMPLLRATPATLHAGPPFAKKASSHWPVSSHARACSFSLRSKCLMRA